jgi:hypothetical protein
MLRRLVTVAFVWFVMQILWALLLATPQDLFVIPAGLPTFAMELAPPLMLAALWLRSVLRSDEQEELLSSAVATRSGFRMVPAVGDSAKGAIICLEHNPAVIPAAEREFAEEQVFGSSDQWKITRQALSSSGNALLDVVTFESSNGQRRELYFDVSRSKSFS